jgi:hypothetical protein
LGGLIDWLWDGLLTQRYSEDKGDTGPSLAEFGFLVRVYECRSGWHEEQKTRGAKTAPLVFCQSVAAEHP